MMIDANHPPDIFGYALAAAESPDELRKTRLAFALPGAGAFFHGYREGEHQLGVVWLEIPTSSLRAASVAYWTWDLKQNRYRTVCYDRLRYIRLKEGENGEQFARRVGREFVQALCAAKDKTPPQRDRLDMLVFP